MRAGDLCGRVKFAMFLVELSFDIDLTEYGLERQLLKMSINMKIRV